MLDVKTPEMEDKPGMIEAKVNVTNTRTSTPVRPFIVDNRKDNQHPSSLNKHFKNIQTPCRSPFDSGYNSLLQVSSATPVNNDDYDNNVHVDQPKKDYDLDSNNLEQPSLFQSILKSRNHSISLEQLVEKVHLKKEQKIERECFEFRSRSFSASEVSRKQKSGSRSSLYRLSSSGVYSDLSLASFSTGSKSNLSDGQSPTLDQVLTMGTNHCQLRSERSYSDDDYDLSELISSLSMTGAGAARPCTPSPEEVTYRRTPESLFGLETFQSYQARIDNSNRVKPKLESITEDDSDQCATPEEYYTSGSMDTFKKYCELIKFIVRNFTIAPKTTI